MRSTLDQMIDLANVFSSQVRITKDVNGKYLVTIEHVSYKENRHDIMQRSICGRGENIGNACADFMDNARGKLLFGDSEIIYGKNRPEYICV